MVKLRRLVGLTENDVYGNDHKTDFKNLFLLFDAFSNTKQLFRNMVLTSTT